MGKLISWNEASISCFNKAAENRQGSQAYAYWLGMAHAFNSVDKSVVNGKLDDAMMGLPLYFMEVALSPTLKQFPPGQRGKENIGEDNDCG